MLLRNWINSCSEAILTQSYGINRWKDTQGRLTQYGELGNYGTSTNLSLNDYTEQDYGSTSGQYSPQYIRICLGSGSTPPTIDDYKMENAIVGVLTSNNQTNPKAPSSPDFCSWSQLTWTQTVTNNTSNSVTVTEIGLFGRVSDTVRQNKPCVLYTRDVISPVTIGVGETKTFVVTIDLTQMSASASAS